MQDVKCSQIPLPTSDAKHMSGYLRMNKQEAITLNIKYHVISTICILALCLTASATSKACMTKQWNYRSSAVTLEPEQRGYLSLRVSFNPF
jgi:hypothetical protein